MKLKPLVKRNPKNQKRRYIIMFIIAFIMITSVIGFTTNFNTNNQQQTYQYNGYEFRQTQTGWVTDYNSYQLGFDFPPYELEDIILPELNFNNKVYIAYDPKDNQQEIQPVIGKLRNILQFFGFMAITACGNEDESCPNIPVVSCESNNSIIKIKTSNQTIIYQENNCLMLQGTLFELAKASDKITLTLAGI